jgi:hypothetical protein
MALVSAVRELPGLYSGPVYFDPAWIPDEYRARLLQQEAERFATPESLARIVGENRAVVGHFGVPELSDAGATRFLAVVREPRVRLVSMYRYWQQLGRAGVLSAQGPWGAAIESAVASGFSGFLRSTEITAHRDNAMARQVLPRALDINDLASSELAARALARQFLRVCWTTEQDLAVEWISDWLGETRPDGGIHIANRTETEGTVERVSRADYEALCLATEQDQLVLDWFMDVGLLTPRSRGDLDGDFTRALIRHKLVLV